MYLTDLLAPARICAGAQANTRKRLLELAAHTLAKPGNDAELERRIYDSLCTRERLGSTGLGLGAAIPHGRIAGLTAPLGAFLQLAQPLEFEAPDAQPVDLVFTLVVPEHFTQQHLMLLSQLASLFGDVALCSRLRQARSDSELLALLSDWQNAHNAA